jgi:hypothetical protein
MARGKLEHQQLNLLNLLLRPNGDTTDSLDTDAGDDSHSPPKGGMHAERAYEQQTISVTGSPAPCDTCSMISWVVHASGQIYVSNFQ